MRIRNDVPDVRNPECDYIEFRSYEDSSFIAGCSDHEIGDWGKIDTEEELGICIDQLIAHHMFELSFYKKFKQYVARYGKRRIEFALDLGNTLLSIERDWEWMKSNKNKKKVSGTHYQDLQKRGMQAMQADYDKARLAFTEEEREIWRALKDYFVYYGLG